MRALTMAIFLLSSLSMYSCGQDQNRNRQLSKTVTQVEVNGASCNCPANVNYVCGANGTTYNNACIAQCIGINYISGPCNGANPPPGTCNCPAYVNYVCGEDGKTYNNSCTAGCSGVSYSAGQCSSSMIVD